jgi:acetylornithine deacetylase
MEERTLTEELIAYDTSNPEGIRLCAGFVKGWLESRDIEARQIGVRDLPVTIAEVGPEDAPQSLLLHGHVDVVPVGDSSAWSEDPFGGAIVDGRLYGRGATDMKGGLAAALWATKVALEQGFRPRGDVIFHIVSDEEVVGNGTREIVDKAPAADITISVEPTELRLCAAEGGLVHFRIEVEGVEAHASTRYLSVHAGGNSGGGVNAVEKVVKIIVALQELEQQWANSKSHPILPLGFDTLAPAIIVGGPGGGSDGRLNLFSNAGTAPNYCSVEYNMWFYPDESFEDVRAEVEHYVTAVCETDPWLREHPPQFTWKLGQIYFPPLDVPLDHPAVRTLAECLGRVGLESEPRGFGAATDLAWYGERKLPGIICGPGRLAQCHVADEFLETEHLIQAARVYGLMVTEWCG